MKVLGLIGGGQLGMMITEAAQKMQDHISKVVVLDPTPNCPAAKVGAEQIVADFKDEKAILELAERCDIVTYEIESGNSEILKKAESKAMINPSPETLRIIQDKFLQKSFLLQNNLPVPEFVEIDSLDDLKEKIKKFGYPTLLKARRDAYDGRGNYKIKSQDDLETAYNTFAGKPMMLEKFVDFKMEVSVIAARNTKGQIVTYPLVENIHENNILKITIAPARVSESVSKQAEKIAHDTMAVLHGAGVFGIEMFVTQDDKIIINEIAPRVHNSGHHTLQSSQTSQFEQHLRAILGLELGSTKLIHPTIMYNILGTDEFSGRYKIADFTAENLYLKMYGKEESKPQRKLGHFNLVDSNDTLGINGLLELLESIKKQIKFIKV
ncbi:MAG: 5-(carboxyamino)imidazole ribonucleotide synthase [Nitrososphaeria archaeon]|nr:5-(carboxyamino)imidazole ribonucleotide synthase [Nitrososphaeria archaeon]NDB51201.1 5-(carboxyamino)imidazole ribonucleotide synthase [Nitrosopumilaceae archaeon]NDB87445.1 5-(carboxyamino)imidazole ribonucleotide synthase [Nitrososphaerota archaeon]NDB91371.1 5-(carboxyamino)imidazole ribonucleotide synthase [Nitrososphaeria archaeon]NDF24773.1 5-(carboxyamino)imidazole ribonucleotide synthase [Nitrososphaerota archaeon]